MTSLAYANPQNADYYTVVEERSKGKETGSITAVDGQMDKGIKTVSYYDYRGRNIQTVSTNHLGGNDMLDDKSYGRIDDLTYKYNGNQVFKITDKVSGPYYKDAMHFVDGAGAEIEYEYDKNGCMTKDLNKKICKIEYNLLNLPTKLNSADGSTISYSYDADGNKLRADYNLSLMNVINGTSSNAQAGNGVTTHRDYCGNFIYEDGALKMLLFDGGYVTFNSSNSPKYHFYLKDHLGNYRVVADANGNIEQVNHYYPFGGLMAESTSGVQPYKYNGKELDRIHGLDSYDYGARWMSDGRFCTQDPHAIDNPNMSPYIYCGNNPIAFLDRNGLDCVYYSQDGLELYRYGANYSKTYVYVIKTYQSTSSMYSESNPKQKGNSNPISENDYIKTRDEIINGNLQGEHMQNVTLFGTTSELMNAYKSIKDNGKGGVSPLNNREYSGSFTEEGVKNVKTGKSGDPSKLAPLISKGNSDYHSHASGEKGKFAWQQPPTKQDIQTCRPNRSEYVFGMRSKIIYKYDKKGVKATLPFNTIIK